jgi:hypothetical protein
MQLLKESEFRSGLYFKHVFEGLLRGTSKDRAEFYGMMLDRGVFCINNVREKEDMDPVDGGDVHLVPLNMTTLDLCCFRALNMVVPSNTDPPGELILKWIVPDLIPSRSLIKSLALMPQKLISSYKYRVVSSDLLTISGILGVIF